MSAKPHISILTFAAAAILATGAYASGSPLSNASDGASKLVNAKISRIGSKSAPTPADTAESGDSRVIRALESADVKYTVDKDGDFRVLWGTGDSRDHLVFVKGKTIEFQGIELREVWAVGFKTESVDADALQKLLELNRSYKIGAWEIAVQNGKTLAVFSLKIPADASGEILKAITSVVAQVADKIEAETTHKDDL